MHFTWHAGCLVSSRAGAAVSSKRPSRVSIVKFYEMKKDSQSQQWPRHTPLLCNSPVRSRPKAGNGHEERSFHVAKTRVTYIQVPTRLTSVHVHGQSSRSCSRVTVPRRRSEEARCCGRSSFASLSTLRSVGALRTGNPGAQYTAYVRKDIESPVQF